MNQHWQLIAYDIRDPRRLRRIQRRVAKQATPLQYSVYLFEGKRQELTTLLNELNPLMDPSQDDLRAYPITHPDALWQIGAPLAPELLRPPRLPHSENWKNPFKRIREWLHV